MAVHQFTTKPPSRTAYHKGCRCDECRQIQSDYTRAYRLKNLEKIRAWERVDSQRKVASGQSKRYGHVYREAHRERIRESSSRWRLENPETYSACIKRYQSSQKSRDCRQKWARNNPDKVKIAQRKWYQKTDKQYYNQRKRSWRAKNPRKVAIYRENSKPWLTEYRQTEQGRKAIQKGWLAYWARKRQAVGTCTIDQLIARWSFYGNRCYICGVLANATDHVIPLSKGGTGWPANLRPICKSCNSRKSNLPLTEFLKVRTVL